jgi:hypothetical protein
MGGVEDKNCELEEALPNGLEPMDKVVLLWYRSVEPEAIMAQGKYCGGAIKTRVMVEAYRAGHRIAHEVA